MGVKEFVEGLGGEEVGRVVWRDGAWRWHCDECLGGGGTTFSKDRASFLLWVHRQEKHVKKEGTGLR